MRLSLRVKTDIPITIDEESEALVADLGIAGAFIKVRPHIIEEKEVGDTVIMKYNLPRYGLIEHHGNIVRKGKGGVAVSFYNLDIATKAKLWEYLAVNIAGFRECPYCGEKYDIMPTVCKTCGWELTFNSPGYFEYLERMNLLKKLYSKADNLGMDHLQRLINFIDVETMKTKASEELQEFVGTSAAMLEVFSKIRKVAPTDLSVLILGESGTGKELTALAIHERSMRKEKLFVPINCAAIPETLLEEELFGHERGAFTGAYTTKKGKFEHADGGTLFLDEIGEFPPGIEAKLLRFLEDRTLERIGATKGKKVDVRLIAATNCDLNSAIAEGKFRKDLYYRLNEFTINLPPVRERGEDRLILAKFFLNKFSGEMGVKKNFSRDAVDSIQSYNWPGNVREIINRVRKAIVMANGSLITTNHLDIDTTKLIGFSERFSLKNSKGKIEKQKIKEALSKCGNNVSKAAKMLGISRPSLYKLIKKHSIM